MCGSLSTCTVVIDNTTIAQCGSTQEAICHPGGVTPPAGTNWSIPIEPYGFYTPVWKHLTWCYWTFSVQRHHSNYAV